MKRIQHRTNQFKATPGVSRERLDLLRQALTHFKSRGILVIGFLPPFSSEVAAALEASDAHRQIWSEYRRQVPAVFAELRMPLVDASTPDALGSNDSSMMDGFHACETFHVVLLQRMLRDPRIREALPSATDALKRPTTPRRGTPRTPLRFYLRRISAPCAHLVDIASTFE